MIQIVWVIWIFTDIYAMRVLIAYSYFKWKALYMSLSIEKLFLALHVQYSGTTFERSPSQMNESKDMIGLLLMNIST